MEKGIEAALGQAQPHNINVASQESSKERVFLEYLRREVHERYRPAFGEVGAILEEQGFRRPELANVGIGSKTNRFLNYVRKIHATGDTWRDAPLRDELFRRMARAGVTAEWADILRDLNALTETVIAHDGKRFAVRSAAVGVADGIARCVGVRLPKAVRRVEEENAGPSA